METYNKRPILGIFVGALIASLLILTGGSRAQAQCFARISSVSDIVAASSKAPLPISAKLADPKPETPDAPAYPSIVGLWHVHYIGPAMPGGDQEAYQIFNAGGTEVHNPNTPTDGVCLGAWDQTAHTVSLTHRVWLYDPTGAFVGVGHLNATINISDRGTTQAGNFTLQVFDLNGNPITPPIPGTLSGERITPN